MVRINAYILLCLSDVGFGEGGVAEGSCNSTVLEGETEDFGGVVSVDALLLKFVCSMVALLSCYGVGQLTY